MKYQGCAVTGHVRQDPADDDVMIARIVDCLGGTVKTGQNVRKNRHSVSGDLIVDAVIDRVVRAREMFGEGLLICSEDVYGEPLGVEIGVERIGYLGDIPKYEWWDE